MTVLMLKGLLNMNCLSLPNSLSLPKSHVDILLFFSHHHVAKLPIRAHRHSQSVKIRTFLWSDLKREVLGFSWAYFCLFKDLLRCPSHVSELLNVHCRGWKIFWAFAASCHSRSESQEYQELIKGLGTSKSCLKKAPVQWTVNWSAI